MPSNDKFHTCGGCATMFDTQEEADSCFDRDCPHDEEGLPISPKSDNLDSNDSL